MAAMSRVTRLSRMPRKVPSMKNLREDRALFLGLARRYGGDYDGWEAQIAR